jgi:hypothetical protein
VKTKSFITVALLAFVVVAVGFLVVKEIRTSEGIASPPGTGLTADTESKGAPPIPHASPAEGRRKVVAYYFHGRVRCVSCVKIETLSRKAITEGFPKDLKSGRLEFRDVNVEEPANRHFIDDYSLMSQSLVVVEHLGGRQVRWRNLDQVWSLLYSEEKFLPYVRGGISAFLKGA